VLTLKEQLSDAGKSVEGVQNNFRQIDTNSGAIEAQLRRFNEDKDSTQKELSIGINYIQTQGEQHIESAEVLIE
jgi:septal ring factor EnvC (AmiA/AmiB activator)